MIGRDRLSAKGSEVGHLVFFLGSLDEGKGLASGSGLGDLHDN